jgi:hypothetical protein
MEGGDQVFKGWDVFLSQKENFLWGLKNYSRIIN